MIFSRIPKALVLSCIIVCSLSFAPVNKGDAQSEISGLTLQVIINQIFDRIDAVLEDARRAGDYLLIRGSQEAIFVLDSFTHSSEHLMDRTFDQIGIERREVITGLNQLVGQLEQSRMQTMEELDSLSQQLDRLVRSSMFRREPLIYRYRGAMVLPGEPQPVRLQVYGYRLGVGEPRLIFHNKSYRPVTNDGKRLFFSIPREAFAHHDANFLSEEARLELEVSNRRWFNPWARSSQITYLLEIISLPNQPGKVEISYSSPVSTRNTAQTRYEPHNRARYRGQSWRCTPYAYTPRRSSKGARVDLTQSWVREGAGDRHGHIRNVVIRETGISFEICTRWRSRSRGPGFRHAIVNLVEYWEEQDSNSVTSSLPLSWVEDALFADLPENIEGVIITVEDRYNNRCTYFGSGDPAVDGTRCRFIGSAIYSPDARAIRVRPQIPRDIREL